MYPFSLSIFIVKINYYNIVLSLEKYDFDSKRSIIFPAAKAYCIRD